MPSSNTLPPPKQLQRKISFRVCPSFKIWASQACKYYKMKKKIRMTSEQEADLLLPAINSPIRAASEANHYLPEVPDALTNAPIESADLRLPQSPQTGKPTLQWTYSLLKYFKPQQTEESCCEMSSSSHAVTCRKSNLFVSKSERWNDSQNVSSRSARCQTAALSLRGRRAEEPVPNAAVHTLYFVDMDFTALK